VCVVHVYRLLPAIVLSMTRPIPPARSEAHVLLAKRPFSRFSSTHWVTGHNPWSAEGVAEWANLAQENVETGLLPKETDEVTHGRWVEFEQGPLGDATATKRVTLVLKPDPTPGLRGQAGRVVFRGLIAKIPASIIRFFACDMRTANHVQQKSTKARAIVCSVGKLFVRSPLSCMRFAAILHVDGVCACVCVCVCVCVCTFCSVIGEGS
jgi:hypothetical protein